MKYFSALLPPPNLTGILHLGHMWNAILQDVLVRFNKQEGKEVYWGYGLDHAGISLQTKVESELKKQGIQKSSLTKEEFQTKLWEWKEIHAQKIREQYRELEFDLPFEDERFTLDAESKKLVLEVFKKLYQEGFIYRDERLVNWDPVLKTAISDIEVIYKSEKAKLYSLKYLIEGTSNYLTVATTRPETIFADVALFVHPDDERYQDLIGKRVKVPFTERYIPILSDFYVDKEFGTGAMKCTPAHDFNDWKLGKKYSLPLIKAYGEEGILLLGRYEGLRKEEVRKVIEKEVEWEEYTTNISYSERSGAKIEPLLSKQWFLKAAPLAKEALIYWKKHKEEMKVSSEERLVEYLENMEDWCISRQLDWGIKIPVWIKDEEHSLDRFKDALPSEDVLDTWFSSSLWPLIVFAKKEELFPISLLVSGRDILLFWISRMVFMTYYLEHKLPFKNIYLHGLVLDSQHRKMSKSLNNGIDPLELKKEYGLEAIRLFFLGNTHQENNIAFSKNKLDYYSKFVHKLKNASIFVASESTQEAFKALNSAEEWLLFKLQEVEQEIKRHYNNLNFAFLTERVISFAWDEFCNKYLELFKLIKKSNSFENTKGFLFYAWNRLLLLLNPLIPSFNIPIKLPVITPTKKPLNMEWFFKYLNTYISIKKQLELDWDLRINTRLVTEKEYSEELLDYLKLLNHELIEVAKERSKERTLTFFIEDVMVELFLPEEKVLKYEKYIVQVKAKLNEELKFLKNRLITLAKAPEHLRKEVQEKITKYENELTSYTTLYGQ
ncbi:valine--tRNA ligase [Candidatus Mycoplasma haematobovis]|uniref:Valine--tRNA ligase n=1 Tax=Candidatus Mycoplasma haematobovis TaxID=432608 RepID=A0A1A9QD60_9MOLU|nr:valine--tRNA ligase [Candidatus Mycoplasma haematobovis]OAL09895.1 valine--tRNA ligase [Candidatus Mycoplasma haematobovis]